MRPRSFTFALAALAAFLLAGAVGYRMGMRLNRVGHAAAGSRLSGTNSAEPDWLEIRPPDAEFKTPAGDPARLSDLKGQVVLLNFWGSWCPPCLVEIPHLVEVQKVLLEMGGTIIGPAVDSGSADDVLRFAEEQGINYPVWMSDDQTAVGKFGAAGYPYTLLIDRQGVIRKRYLGPQTSATLLRDIRALAASGS
jgi:thiol-disulfide isomerase/thioredoxin